MSTILVAFSTNSGSTGEVAYAVAAELNLAGHSADVKSIKEVKDLEGYDAVVLGAPMIFGWQSTARRFLKNHQVELRTKKVAYFACAMRLTLDKDQSEFTVPLALDPNLVSHPEKPGSLTLKERFTTIEYYLKPILKASPNVKPVSVAFFKGKLEMYKLKWWQAAFVMVVVQGVAGDYRDWDYIKSWSNTLSKLL